MQPRTWDLSQLDWTLEGWRQWEWKIGGRPEIGRIPARVPGSVRGNLLAAGIVPDPFHGLGSRASEFIENRHWIFRAKLPIDLPEGDAVLEFDSLDGSVEVSLGSTSLGVFDNSHLAQALRAGPAAALRGEELRLVFLTQPDELGQIGWTSRMRAWKPRFNYGWDWTPRIVQIGPAKEMRLRVAQGPRLAKVIVETDFDRAGPAHGRGRVAVRAQLQGARPGDVARLAVVDPAGTQVAEATTPIAPAIGVVALSLRDLAVESWWGDPGRPAGLGRPLYSVEVDLVGADGAVADSAKRRVGFRDLRWRSNPGAPPGADTWLLEIDGGAVFAQGVNWVPIRPDYADVPAEWYRSRLETYRRLGVNLLRVWGGATIEHPLFYDLCDELGLLVWQELPLSSSGIDNCPPEDVEFCDDLAGIARQWAERLVHHPCLALWSGGNELSRGDPPHRTPLDFSHAALSAAREAIRGVDTSRRIVPTSGSGPREVAAAAELGQGLHHDVHGPWTHGGDLTDWERYWAADDALFRSEVGAAGASDIALLDRFGLLPGNPEYPSNWLHSSSWWLDGFDFPDDKEALGTWVQRSQARQADLLAIAARACKARFPACGGFIVWMGHDTFPCPVNLSILDFDGNVKPAGHALAAVFASDAGRGSDLRVCHERREDREEVT